MTPTEQDSNGDGTLKQRIYEEIAFIFAGKDLSHEQIAALMDDRKESVELIMRLITADRKRVALEAEMNTWKQVRKSYPKKQTLQGKAVSRLTLADVDRKITELKAQQEKFGYN